jgi:nicotinic acid mononucleotide adenylyltransferase
MSKIPTLVGTQVHSLTRLRTTATIGFRGPLSEFINGLAHSPGEEWPADVEFSYKTNPDSDSSTTAALNLAQSSLVSARQRYSASSPTLESVFQHTCVGVGCVSSVDGNQMHVAAATENETLVWKLATHHSHHSQSGESVTAGVNSGVLKDVQVSNALRYSLARAITNADDITIPPKPEDLVRVLARTTSDDGDGDGNEDTNDPLTQMLSGRASSVAFNMQGDKAIADISVPPGCLIFPGSFNPLHQGHVGVVEAAVASLNATRSSDNVPSVAYEISAEHPDKGLLSREEILDRVEQFRGKSPVIVSRAALYVEKCDLYKGAVFLVGADACSKILNPKYTGGSLARMYTDLATIRRNGCQFLVAGRKDEETGGFQKLEHILEKVPLADRDFIRPLFQQVDFRLDISSTDIRQKQGHL